MATCGITGTLLDASGTAISGATITARTMQGTVSGTSLVVPFEVSTSTDTSGNFTITLTSSLNVLFEVGYPITGTEMTRTLFYSAAVPVAASANFTSIITIE